MLQKMSIFRMFFNNVELLKNNIMGNVRDNAQSEKVTKHYIQAKKSFYDCLSVSGNLRGGVAIS